MNTWISVLWAGCALMACWSFSLFVRLISERVAQKRDRLASRYSKRSTLIALLLMVLCAGVSVGLGYLAIDLFEDFNPGSSPWVNAATVIGWAVIAFGMLLLIWWAIGDRARGRVRCPKCWYDMSAAVDGESGLRCPECGKVAKDASKFGKSRRARWMAALALFFLGTGWYGVIAGPRVAETEEWLAAVPTWVLMAGWQVFPEEWIIEDNTKLIVYESCLSNRLNDYFEYDSVADWHRVRFGRRLLKGMLRSTEARWDPARLELLDSVSWELTQSKVESDDAVLSDYFPAETNIIFRKSVEDIIEALSAPTPSVVQLQILEKIRNYDTSAHEMTTEWIWQAFRSAHSDLDYDQTNKMAQLYISKLYDGLDDQILDEQFRKNLDSSDESRFGPALYIAEQSGQIKSLYTSLFVFDPELQNAPFNKRAFLLGLTTRELTESEMNPILTDLSDILESDDQYEVGYGVYALLATQRLRKLNSDSEFEQYQRTYQVARNLVVRDDSVLREFEPESIEFKIYTQLLRIVMNHDVGGQDAYPLIQAALRLHPLAAPYLPFYRIEDRMDLATIDLWVDSFIEFAHSEDARVRSWFITNIPVKTGSVHDELLNQVAASYLNDSDPEIVHEAKSKLNLREADHLIKDD